MNRFIGGMLAAIALVALPGCSLFRAKPPEKKKEEPKSKLVGRVASISSDKKFVLIQSYGVWEVPVGSVLTTQAEGDRASNLRSTGEKLGQFAAADIQAGMPTVGDAVFLAPPEAPDPHPVPPTPDKPKAPENIPAPAPPAPAKP